MTAVYTAPHYTFQEARGGSGLLRLAAKYEFLRVVRAECGQKVFNSSSGQLSLRSLGSDIRCCSVLQWSVQQSVQARPCSLQPSIKTSTHIVQQFSESFNMIFLLIRLELNYKSSW